MITSSCENVKAIGLGSHAGSVTNVDAGAVKLLAREATDDVLLSVERDSLDVKVTVTDQAKHIPSTSPRRHVGGELGHVDSFDRLLHFLAPSVAIVN